MSSDIGEIIEHVKVYDAENLAAGEIKCKIARVKISDLTEREINELKRRNWAEYRHIFAAHFIAKG